LQTCCRGNYYSDYLFYSATHQRVAKPCPECRHSDSELTGGAAGVLAHATYRPDEKVGGPAPLFYVASSFITSLMCY
jgi:hypothetical protein